MIELNATPVVQPATPQADRRAASPTGSVAAQPSFLEALQEGPEVRPEVPMPSAVSVSVGAPRPDEFLRQPVATGKGLEVEVLTHHGDVEIIALPWTLIATGILQQSVERVMHQGSSSAPELMGVPLSGSGPSAPTRSLQSAAASSLAPNSNGQQRRSSVAWVPEAVKQIGSADTTEAADAPTTPRDPTQWQKQLVRFIQHMDEDLTVRWRDYRLQKGDVERLVSDLSNFAHNNGVRLRRVVVNGLEHWSGIR